MKTLRHMIARWDAVNGPASEVADKLRRVIESTAHDLGQTHHIVRATQRGLAKLQLRLLLNQWDPPGVSSAHNTDEYDCLIEPLLTRLNQGEGYAGIIRYLRQELDDHFGLAPRKYTAVVDRYYCGVASA